MAGELYNNANNPQAINMFDNFLPLTLYPPNYLIWIFTHLKFVSRWRDPQLQVSENYSGRTKWRSTIYC